MRPRTKIQREVAALFPTLPPITAKQEQYAFAHSHEYIGYFSVGEIWCTNCGQVSGNPDPIARPNNGDEYICPHCGAKLKIQRSTKKKSPDKRYFTILTTCQDWQVVRHFLCYWNVRKGYEVNSHITEVVQMWLKADGTEVIVARACTLHGGDSWDLWRPLEIRTRHHSWYDYDGQKYNIWADYIYPEYSVLPIFKRNGFNLNATKKGMPPCRLMLALLKDPEAEFLVKTGQYGLLNYFKYKRGSSCHRYLHAIKICNRNGYKVKDGSMWTDYIDLLEYFHLDTHNAHYVCPKNLKAEHDQLHKRKEKVEAKRRAEEQKRNAIKWEAEYKKEKGAYFGICFGDENIQIAVITSVADMAEEGAAMHHCVYNAGYYKRPDCIILSARDKDGNRLETIELSLRTFEVIQSRGKCNQSTPYHDQILSLVRENIGLFRKVA